LSAFIIWKLGAVITNLPIYSDIKEDKKRGYLEKSDDGWYSKMGTAV
jgi:hypothetical protein